jgi:hypothetical protein
MADMLQSSQVTATTAPSYYTDYLTNLANQGQQAAQGAQYVGAQPLQQEAFSNVARNVNNYVPALTQAQGTLGQAAGMSPLSAAQPYFNNANVDPSQLAQQYMNPYTQDVVNSIGTLGQRNIQQNLAPMATAGAVGSGQFGSQRGAQVLGQTIQNANTDILAQQNQALQAGYQNAMTNAQKQQALEASLGQTAGGLAATGQGNLINAATVGGNLAGQTQALGLGDVNALATLGGQQQTIGQNAQLFPLQALNQQSALLRGYTIPTTSTQTYNGSPLSAIASLGAMGAGLFTKNASGTTPFANLMDTISGAKSAIGSIFSPDTPTQPSNNQTIDANGNPIYGGGQVINDPLGGAYPIIGQNPIGQTSFNTAPAPDISQTESDYWNQLSNQTNPNYYIQG